MYSGFGDRHVAAGAILAEHLDDGIIMRKASVEETSKKGGFANVRILHWEVSSVVEGPSFASRSCCCTC